MIFFLFFAVVQGSLGQPGGSSPLSGGSCLEMGCLGGVLGSSQAGHTNSPPHGLSSPVCGPGLVQVSVTRLQKGNGTCARLPEAKPGTGVGSPSPCSLGQSKSPGQPTFKARDHRRPLLNERRYRGTLPRTQTQRPPVHSVRSTQDETELSRNKRIIPNTRQVGGSQGTPAAIAFT